MASFKANLNQSLQLQLSLWLTAIVIILALIAGTFSFVTSFKEMNEVQDDLLRQIASLFDAEYLPVAHHGDSGRLANSDEESRVIVQYLSNPSVSTKPNANPIDGELPLTFPDNLADGIQTVNVEHESYRALVKTISSDKKIVIAQETAVRNEIAESGALRTLTPFLILLPILLLTNTLLIRKLFKPVSTLSEEISHRDEQDLHAFETRGLPSEISPFVLAINQLLEKISQSMRAQRRFIADAAHELRSPMTALSLQAEHLTNAEMSNQAKDRVSTLRQGLERNRHLLNQLLELARVESTPQSRSKRVSIKNTYRNVLEDLHALAEVKQIDIGLVDGDDAELITDEADLFVLIKNIVDNAIRYTPNGGKIDLAIKDLPNQTQLIVTDSGPGISIADRQRVMDPFYRVLGSNQTGSGLGLSIVQGVAAKMGWHINLAFAHEPSKSGLIVTVIIHKFNQ